MSWFEFAGQALGGLLGGAAQGGISYASAQQQQAATRDAYQHRYQWTMEDMRKAGLNPLLAASHGAGNVGSMAQMETPNIAAAAQVASQVNMQNAQAEAASAAAEVDRQEAFKRSWDAVSAQVKGEMDQMSYNLLAGHDIGPNGGPMTPRQKAAALLNAGQLFGLPASSLAGPAASAYGSTVNAVGNLGAAGLLRKLVGPARGVIKGFAQ